jgi:hypothetical protein
MVDAKNPTPKIKRIRNFESRRWLSLSLARIRIADAHG